MLIKKNLFLYGFRNVIAIIFKMILAKKYIKIIFYLKKIIFDIKISK
jgi:hypothetical protein